MNGCECVGDCVVMLNREKRQILNDFIAESLEWSLHADICVMIGSDIDCISATHFNL